MTSDTWDRFGLFRAEAEARGVPAEDVERWLATARPCLTLTPADEEGGPVVGRFGGPLLLPADAPDPVHPHVASVDLAALPAGATDLPLPPDGHLLFFAALEPDGVGPAGGVVHVAAGTAVTPRDPHAWNTAHAADDDKVFADYPQGPLRAKADVSLPYHQFVVPPGEREALYLPEHPRCSDLVEVWEDTQDRIAPSGPLQIGGYADEEAVEFDPVDIAASTAAEAVEAGHWDGPVSADAADWVLLADWYAGRHVRNREGSTVHWVIQREDLAAHRFERVFTTVFWNP
ncbi:DUF1963 domain-containing protein [uncultured Streptomyces sp.]|uniref:DUF1963 domain-containing protein n=1 Tax=uncultured Streptomyces sp. TaxID=174707 RepID=UPI00260FA5F0|nr:DUF1963 domain-containing protein [uncultured Streptomyces sp.]